MSCPPWWAHQRQSAPAPKFSNMMPSLFPSTQHSRDANKYGAGIIWRKFLNRASTATFAASSQESRTNLPSFSCSANPMLVSKGRSSLYGSSRDYIG